MSARAIWKGNIRLGSIVVPVKFYAAVQDKKIHFRLLHKKDNTPVSQKMVNPNTGEVVPSEEIRHGYITDEGEIVLLSEEELASLEPESSREINITRFVDPEHINHQWYGRPYYLGPDKDIAAYFALAEACRETKLEGVVRWIMRKKRYIGALRAEGGYLKIITLYHPGEIVKASELPRPTGRPLEKQERSMAAQLVKTLAGQFNPEEYHDEYRARVQELLETKIKGGTVKFKKAKEKKIEAISLSDLLERSLKQAKEEKEHASST